MHVRSLFTRVIVGIAGAIVLVAIGALAYQLMRAQLSDAILTKIDRLALQPPESTPELEWVVLVYWTHNLHCAAIPQLNGSISSLRQLDRELNDFLARGPDIQAIETLWDRYARMSASGSEYRAQHEPVRDEIVDTVAREGKGYFDIGSYQDFLTHVRPTVPAVN